MYGNRVSVHIFPRSADMRIVHLPSAPQRASAPVILRSSPRNVGLLVTLTAKPETAHQLENWLKDIWRFALDEQGTMSWYAFKLNERIYGIYDTFLTEEGREQHIHGNIVKSLRKEQHDTLASHARQFLQCRQPAKRHIGFAVSALMHQHQTALVHTLRRLTHHPRHHAERVTVQQHARQRVDGVGVIAAVDNDQLGLETLQCGNHDLLHGMQIRLVTAAGRQGNVNVGAQSVALATIMRAAVTRWKTPFLMQGEGQHIAPSLEYGLEELPQLVLPGRHLRWRIFATTHGVIHSQHAAQYIIPRVAVEQPVLERTRDMNVRRSKCCLPPQAHPEWDRLRLRGMSGTSDEFTLAAAVQNLRRLAKLASQGSPVTGEVRLH